MSKQISENKNLKDTVCAVVVTYNRKNLLLECLEALLKQTRPIDAMYIIDNFSSDGTPEALKENGYIINLPPYDISEPWEREFEVKNLTDGQPVKIHYVRMNENTGGAGGFYEGVKRGYEKGYDWLWLMDDDVIPKEDALNYLVDVLNFGLEGKIGFVCSKVLWTDDTPHIMNLPQISHFVNNKPFNFYDDKGLLLVPGCSFVSVLIYKNVIEEVGLPIKELFIWADDIEYTSRITSKGYIGIYCPSSAVIHKTKYNYSVRYTDDKMKHFYGVRNNLYLQRKKGKLRFILHFIHELLRTFEIKHDLVLVHLKGVMASLFFNPKIQKVGER
jgi:GT2 family glycosyltransferase